MQPAIGVIGGSGLYEIEGLTDIREERLETPFGAPSDAYICGVLDGVKMVFLPRHGRGHRLLPSEVNYRANIYGMKLLGVERIISVSAVGSMKEAIAPGHIVIPDQFFDRTQGKRASTFFGNGVVGHVQFADPVCSELSAALYGAAVEVGATAHRGGTYICIEGPNFSTRAESNIYRSWGVDVIGMTNLQEAKLAREAEICYATLAMVTDYDCWHEEEEAVSGTTVMEVIQQNVATAQDVVRRIVRKLPIERTCPCATALAQALITDPAVIPKATLEKLGPIVGRYLKVD
ncbi:MAG TPA: S-methyl-5'-thioadenosine phosphorylase [Thermoanaerobaculia bacterium]|nr:S-methyl-5'-thioadenosine phosphorylase [Thermoanaerobaculia bacterium]